MILIPALLAIAYRGKGSRFWGLSPINGRWLSSLLAGACVALLHGLAWLLPFATLWFLFIAPDIGTGFASIHGNARTFLEDITRKRRPLSFPLSLMDALARRIPHTRLAGTVWMTGRQLYILPFMALHIVLGGNAWALLGLLLLGCIYFLAGAAVRATGEGEAVCLAEWTTGFTVGVLCI